MRIFINILLSLACFFLELRWTDGAEGFNSPTWELLEIRNGVEIFRRPVEGSSFVSFRAEAHIPAPMAQVYTLMIDLNLRKQWVFGLAEVKILHSFNPKNYIEYSRLNLPWPFADRSFLNEVKLSYLEENEMLHAKFNAYKGQSVVVDDRILRSEVITSEWTLKPNQQGTTISLHSTVDLHGWIPIWLNNKIVRYWPYLVLRDLKHLLRKRGEVAIDPSYFDLVKSLK